METIGLFYGSDTGMTEDVTDTLTEMWTVTQLEVFEIGNACIEDMAKFDKLILGLSTWFDGDLQSDWEAFFEEELPKVDFTNKKVAIYGLGDQYCYEDFFVDGIGILARAIIKQGGQIIGLWSKKGYTYAMSKAEVDDNTDLLYGLAIDDINEPELTEMRLIAWLDQIKKEFGIIEE